MFMRDPKRKLSELLPSKVNYGQRKRDRSPHSPSPSKKMMKEIIPVVATVVKEIEFAPPKVIVTAPSNFTKPELFALVVGLLNNSVRESEFRNNLQSVFSPSMFPHLDSLSEMFCANEGLLCLANWLKNYSNLENITCKIILESIIQMSFVIQYEDYNSIPLKDALSLCIFTETNLTDLVRKALRKWK